MRAIEIIEKKRNNIELDEKEIEFLLKSYQNKIIPDYQMSAFLMSVYFNGITENETFYFTKIMMESGEIIKFKNINKYLIDKHSTGGVGDKLSLILAPVLSYFNIGIAKLSGKGLGHTGGTVDKFNSIKNFKFPESLFDMENLVNKTGIGIMSYSDNIVPLDKMLYSLRDVSATVESIPLIASSIMSKKLAVMSDSIILDVKLGDGAFMKDVESARELAKTMINIGNKFNRKTSVVLSNMNEPLGFAVGNSLELIESIEALKGNIEENLKELVLKVSAIALVNAKICESIEEGILKVEEILNEGKALNNLKSFIEICGGNTDFFEDYSKILNAKIYEYTAKKDGYINLKAYKIGKSAMILGAGRAKKDDELDYNVGIYFQKKTGAYLKQGDLLARIYYNDEKKLEEALKYFEEGIEYSEKKIEKMKIIFDVIV